MKLSYKNLHALKHGLEKLIEHKRQIILSFNTQDVSNIDYNTVKQYEKDIIDESKLLKEVTEKINYLKDLYKIQ